MPNFPSILPTPPSPIFPAWRVPHSSIVHVLFSRIEFYRSEDSKSTYHVFASSSVQLYRCWQLTSARVLLVFGVREYAWTRISRLARMVNFCKQELPFYWASSATLLPPAPSNPLCRTSQRPLTRRLEYLIVQGPFSTIVPASRRCWCC